jgi:hypothetical protein
MLKAGQVPEACHKIKKAAQVYAGPYWKCRPYSGVFRLATEGKYGRKGHENIFIRGTGNKKGRNAMMSSILTAILHLVEKIMPKEMLRVGLVFQCQNTGWMTNDFMVDWIKVAWNQRPGSLLSNCGMLV